MSTASRTAAIRSVANNAILRNALTETASVIDEVVVKANQRVELHITHDRHQFVPELAVANENQKPLYQAQFRKRKINQVRTDIANNDFQGGEGGNDLYVYQSQEDIDDEKEISDFAVTRRFGQFGLDDPTLQVDPPAEGSESSLYTITAGERSPLFFGVGEIALTPTPNDLLTGKAYNGLYSRENDNLFITSPKRIGNAAIEAAFSVLTWGSSERQLDISVPADADQPVNISVAVFDTAEEIAVLADPESAPAQVRLVTSGAGEVEVTMIDATGEETVVGTVETGGVVRVLVGPPDNAGTQVIVETYADDTMGEVVDSENSFLAPDAKPRYAVFVIGKTDTAILMASSLQPLMAQG